MKSFWTAFLLIFVAELGDKTQFMTLALSSRHSASIVLLGVSLGTMLVSLFSVALGRLIGNIIPAGLMNILAGLIFIFFGLSSLKQSKEEDDDAGNSKNGKQHIIWLSIAITFFIAELADKTMIATVAIASRDTNYLAVWAGSSLGLIASNCLAIIAGKTIGKYLQGRSVHILAASIFIIAGIFALKQGLFG